MPLEQTNQGSDLPPKGRGLLATVAILCLVAVLAGNACRRDVTDMTTIVDPAGRWQLQVRPVCNIDPEHPPRTPDLPMEGLASPPENETFFSLQCTDPSQDSEVVDVSVFRQAKLPLADQFTPILKRNSLAMTSRVIAGTEYWAWPNLGAEPGTYLVVEKDGWVLLMEMSENAVRKFGNDLSNMVKSFATQ